MGKSQKPKHAALHEQYDNNYYSIIIVRIIIVRIIIVRIIIVNIIIVSIVIIKKNLTITYVF